MNQKKMTMRGPEEEMSVFETILARRSVRSYTGQEVDRGVIHTLLEAAVRAPTAVHGEPWAFVVIQDKARLRQLSDRAKPLFAAEARRSGLERAGFDLQPFLRPEFNIFHDAGTLIAICASAMEPFAAADCWLAAENLMLAACAMGLGSCVIGTALPALNVASVKAELGIPDRYSVIAPIIVGHPSGETALSSRMEPFVLAYLQPAPAGNT